MARALALGESLRHIMDTLGLTPRELARTVGASDKTVARWLADETYPQHSSREKLDELERLTDRLLDAFDGPESIALWIRNPTRSLALLRPIDALVAGQVDRVDGALETILSGIYV
jgi:transcriptional regulator with XRE-family HTH domain